MAALLPWTRDAVRLRRSGICGVPARNHRLCNNRSICAMSLPLNALQAGCLCADQSRALLEAITANGWDLDTASGSCAAGIAAASVAASKRIYPYVTPTPLAPAPFLSTAGDCTAFLKLESEQVTGSFKARGAVAKVTSLSSDELRRGLLTSSTGNHGLAFAYATAAVPAAAAAPARPRVYVPETAVAVKKDRLRAQGVQVVEYGSDCLEAELRAAEAAEEEGGVYVSPYNDGDVIAGQGTVGLELLAQLPASSAASLVVFVPVGGGGLAAGIAGVLKAAHPAVTIVGCQPEASQVMRLSVEAGTIVDAPSRDTLSDGTAGGVERGSVTLRPCVECIDEWVCVSEADIAGAMVAVLERQGKLVEGSAGVAVAAAMRAAARGDLRGKTAVAICCGGNVALEKLQLALHLAGRA